MRRDQALAICCEKLSVPMQINVSKSVILAIDALSIVASNLAAGQISEPALDAIVAKALETRDVMESPLCAFARVVRELLPNMYGELASGNTPLLCAKVVSVSGLPSPPCDVAVPADEVAPPIAENVGNPHLLAWAWTRSLN